MPPVSLTVLPFDAFVSGLADESVKGHGHIGRRSGMPRI
jgi:hypothetical protein